MVRLLADCRALNRSCVDSPLHHYDCCPTQLDMCSRIPYGSKYFKKYDISDAFHSCKVSAESADLLVVQYGDEYYQYTGGAQGIANMAVHWNIHLADAFDKILGFHWREWFTIYVDDLGVHGFTEAQARNRGRILEAMLTALNKPCSDKTGTEVTTSLELAGLHFDEHGVRLSDDAFATLTECLTEYTVKNATDVLHVIGVINYCNSAYRVSI